MPDQPPPSRDPDPGSSLGRAVQLALTFRSSGRTDIDRFLAAHESLRELLEPMLRRDSEVEADGPPDAEHAATTPAGPPMFGAGSRIAGYVVERRLGQGGMGTVLLATQESLGRRVALKVLSAPLALLAERSRWRFQRESRLLAELDHPGIVRVFEAGTVEDRPFFAMEFVDGAPVSAVLDAVRRAGLHGASAATVRLALFGAIAATPGDDDPPPRDDRPYVGFMVDLVAQVGEALAHAHAAGVVHRDVKPSNVLMRRDGRALLADFGIAHRDGGTRMTVTGDLAGTPSHMSPEQARGDPIDHRTDVFSLGVLLYECVTLQLPFGGETRGEVLDALQRRDPVDPRRHNPAVSADLAAIVGKALQKEPDHRYQSASDFAADLRALSAGQSIKARHPTAWQRMLRWARREPWRATAAGVALLAISGGLVGGLLATQRIVAEARRTAAALADVHRLAIGVRLERAELAARAFRVARFELVPAMEQWLATQARPLAAELPDIERLRDALAAQAAPPDASAAALDDDDAAEVAALRAIERELAAPDPDANAEKRRQHLLARRTELRQRIEQRHRLHFTDEQTQFLYDQVTALAQRLQRFATTRSGALQRIQRQLAWAEESERRCRVEGAAAWQRAIAAIAAEPRYGGLELTPQRDLLPLGPDPRSGLWEFVHLRSGEPGKEVPPRTPEGVLQPTDEMAVVFVLLPGGKVTMGAQAVDAAAANHDAAAGPYETPVHVVELEPFFLAKYETTQQQWQRLSDGGNPSVYAFGRQMTAGPQLTGRNPVENVSQRMALEVLQQHGLGLPTEAQWEYACRAGTSTPWHFGARELAVEYANFADRAAVRGGARWETEPDLDDGHIVHAPVGSFRCNDFGLHDMHGNVSELTLDRMAWYWRPTEPGSGLRVVPYDARSVVFRGGDHGMTLTALRSSDRSLSETVDYRSGTLGVRAARAVER